MSTRQGRGLLGDGETSPGKGWWQLQPQKYRGWRGAVKRGSANMNAKANQVVGGEVKRTREVV